MRRGITTAPFVVVFLLGSLLSGLAATAQSQTGGQAYVLRLNWGPELPETLDPQHSDLGQWSMSGGLDWEGLTRIDEELQPVPGAAESWEFSADGKILTFHLRDGLVFSDGVPVTAEHFRYAAERICSPQLNSRSRGSFVDLIGCEEIFNAADDTAAAAAARAALGVRALDDHTLEYQFTRPAPYFPALAANWGTIPLRKDLIEAGGPDWWANPATRIGNGPFRLAEYEADGPDKRVVYARNDAYWGGGAKLDGIEFSFIDYGDSEIEAYRRGELDVIWPRSSMIPTLEADPELSRDLVALPIAGTVYFQFNLTREPFQDKNVREAFAYAFDRKAYCWQRYGLCTPTLSMVPPGVPGSIQTDAYAFDPEKARQALAESSYGGPEHVPEITWYYEEGSDADLRNARWYYEQFHQVLGLELTLVPIEWEALDALYDDPATVPQFAWSVWWGGADLRSWFVIWRCDSPFDYGEGYCNPDLDALLDRADAELDPDKSVALYEEAGRMLVADAPAIFAHTDYSTVLVKPSVVGYSRTTPYLNGNWPGWMNLMTVDVVPSD
jgi:oligopeptide transport system substrate-binding protein